MSWAGQIVMDKFYEASNWLMIGLSYLAAFDEKGNREPMPRFPFNMLFQGSKEARALFGDGFVSDQLAKVLSIIPPNTVLYNVWAEEPNMNPLKIGEITLTTKLISSKFGDKDLFLQHIRKEEDFSLRPDWIDFATQMVNKQSNTPYYNGPNDLPDNM